MNTSDRTFNPKGIARCRVVTGLCRDGRDETQAFAEYYGDPTGREHWATWLAGPLSIVELARLLSAHSGQRDRHLSIERDVMIALRDAILTREIALHQGDLAAVQKVSQDAWRSVLGLADVMVSGKVAAEWLHGNPRYSHLIPASLKRYLAGQTPRVSAPPPPAPFTGECAEWISLSAAVRRLPIRTGFPIAELQEQLAFGRIAARRADDGEPIHPNAWRHAKLSDSGVVTFTDGLPQTSLAWVEVCGDHVDTCTTPDPGVMSATYWSAAQALSWLLTEDPSHVGSVPPWSPYKWIERTHLSLGGTLAEIAHAKRKLIELAAAGQVDAWGVRDGDKEPSPIAPAAWFDIALEGDALRAVSATGLAWERVRFVRDPLMRIADLRPLPQAGPKPGQTTLKAEWCQRAIDALENREVRPGHGAVAEIARILEREGRLGGRQLQSAEKEIRRTVREWESRRPEISGK